jgi:hypothetical protein
MNKIEQMHLDAIKYEEASCMTQDGDYIQFVENHNYYDVAVKSAEITEQIAIEFVQWYENRDKSIDENMLTWEDYYREFLKTKQ